METSESLTQEVLTHLPNDATSPQMMSNIASSQIPLYRYCLPLLKVTTACIVFWLTSMLLTAEDLIALRVEGVKNIIKWVEWKRRWLPHTVNAEDDRRRESVTEWSTGLKVMSTVATNCLIADVNSTHRDECNEPILEEFEVKFVHKWMIVTKENTREEHTMNTNHRSPLHCHKVSWVSHYLLVTRHHYM